jgi:hypothetical protein
VLTGLVSCVTHLVLYKGVAAGSREHLIQSLGLIWLHATSVCAPGGGAEETLHARMRRRNACLTPLSVAYMCDTMASAGHSASRCHVDGLSLSDHMCGKRAWAA